MEEEKLLLEEEKEFKRFYRLSLWWLEHRVLLRKIAFGIFIAFDSVLLLFVFWTMLNVFVVNYGSVEQEVAKLAVLGQQDLRAYSVANRAEDILLTKTRVFSIGNQRYDFYTEATNPNDDWWVEFDYQFLYGSGNSTIEKGFLLPGQTKPLVALAVNSTDPLRDVQLELLNVAWHRIDHHEIADYVTWQNDRLNIEIVNPIFTQETGFENEIFGRTVFTVRNQTAFSYFDPEFYVLLKNGSAVVGVNKATVTNMGTGEEKEITLNWFGVMPTVTSVEVITDIFLFDPNVYQRIKGAPGLDTRTFVQPQ